MPIGKELRRFRTGLTEVTALAPGSATSRDQLITRFFNALAAADTAGLAALVLDRSEYAYLYYPHTIYTKRPYRQAPSLHWFMLQQNSERGVVRALRRFGGTPVQLSGYACEDAPLLEEDNRIWNRCTVSVQLDGTTRDPRLFGSVLERDDRFKFVSYANDL